MKTRLPIDYLLFTNLLVANIVSVYPSIVDVKSPIVIHDAGSNVRNSGVDSSNDNYFGYSLAFIKNSFDEQQQATPPPRSSTVKFPSSGQPWTT